MFPSYKKGVVSCHTNKFVFMSSKKDIEFCHLKRTFTHVTQIGFVSCHTKRPVSFVIQKRSFLLSYTKGIVSCYAKRMHHLLYTYKFIWPCLMSYKKDIFSFFQKGFVSFHTKNTLSPLVKMRIWIMSYKCSVLLFQHKYRAYTLIIWCFPCFKQVMVESNWGFHLTLVSW